MSEVPPPRRDVVLVGGADAESYLQGQLSQDVAGLAVGQAAFSLLLQPQGKVDAFLRVTRLGADRFALDVDAGWGEQVVARLRRFLLRVKVDVELAPEWSVIAVDGMPEPPTGAWAVLPEVPRDGVDLLGPDLVVPAGFATFESGAYEELRILAGVPRMGSELDERTIPATAGIVDRTVSFTKGCYTGQELVARIDSRGDKVPTKLRRLVGSAPLVVGAEVAIDGRAIGVVTSVSGVAALAYVRREVEMPAEVTAGGTPARVEALPVP